MVAFVVSFAITIGLTALCFVVGSRRPRGTPLTWGEAFVGGTVVFAIMLLAYGVVPHQWLTFADNDLLWRADKIMMAVSSEGVRFGQEAGGVGGDGRILVNAQAVRDMIATAIYGLFFVMHLWGWAIWQKRGTRKTSTDVAASSAFGRPVTAKASS